MSRSSDLLATGWGVLLEEHETTVTYTPSGGSAVELKALDNGQPEDVAALALNVDGISRIISVTRGAASYAAGASVTIGTDTYKVLGVRQRSALATDLLLGATVVSGRQ